MDTLDEALTDEVVRSYGATLYRLLLETASLHCRLPEFYEDTAAWPADEALMALPVLVDLTKLLREHADGTRDLIVSLDRLPAMLRGMRTAGTALRCTRVRPNYSRAVAQGRRAPGGAP